MRRLLFSGSVSAVLVSAWVGIVFAAENPPPAVPLPAAASQKVEFNRDIRPLFQARCVACHGAKTAQGGLRLHRKADAEAGGDHGLSWEAGKSAESRLIRYVAGLEKGKRMPPAGEPLTAREIGLLRAWVDQGAPWPEDGPAEQVKTDHWSFQPVRRPPVPAVKSSGWVKNPIDSFILARLEKAGVKPSPEADRVTLIRRVHLDLLGLPPAPEEVDRFVSDREAGAYERMVDRALASPAYGERQARFWLDQARYADSNGYTIDSRRSIWKYRDWVIDAYNRDLPFDEFTIEQLAGDLLPHATLEQRVATGFHRNTLINEEGGTDPEQFRVEAVMDRTATTGTVWLGLTVGCAQCHTHKFDPISQREYYSLFAFFNDQDEPTVSFPAPEQEASLKEIRRDLADARRALAEYDKAHPDTDKKSDKERQALSSRVTDLTRKEKDASAAIPTSMVLKERPEPRASHVLIRGDFLRPGPPVDPGVPAVMPALKPAGKRANRLDLARWLVDGRNPLTGRVLVNRIWGQHFGVGFVDTDNDLGTQGSKPTHPELLDWLAASLAEKGPGGLGWSQKRLHRLIVTSATYRQASRARPDLAELDPTNKLLARMPRVRLEAEAIRDAALASSGLLTMKVGGPSVFPPQPGGLDAFTQSKKNWTASKGEDRFRRGLYTFRWRSSPYPLFATFDAPDGNTACTRRARSNTPLGALMLANDGSLFEMFQGLALLTLKAAPASDAERVRFAFRRCLSRDPGLAELQRLLSYVQAQRSALAAAPDQAAKIAPAKLPDGVTAPEAATWVSLARVLMNLDEFITRE